CRIPLAQSVLRVSLPVQRRICLRTVHVHQLLEFCRRPVVAVFIQILTPVVVQLLQSFDLFLGPLPRFLFLFALFVFSLSCFLLAFPLLLFFVLGLLWVLERIRRSHGKCLECTRARDCRRQQQSSDGDPGDTRLSN